MHKYFVFSIAVLLGSAAAHGVAPTVVVPAYPVDGTWSPIPIPLAALGIDPAAVTLSGALRGEVYSDGTRFFYLPDRSKFPQTDFDLLRVAVPGAPTVVNVAVVRAESETPRELVAHAGYTAVPDPGWSLSGAAVWDAASGSYVVEAKGELEFDFMRDDVTDRTFDTSAHGGQSGSGSSVTLRPPPPGAPFAVPGSMMVYQGGSGDDLWELWLHPSEDGYQLEAGLTTGAGASVRATVPVPDGPQVGIDFGSSAGNVLLSLTGVGGTTYHPLVAPPGFTSDRTWHRFGNLEGRGDAVIELDHLRVARSSVDLTRQVVIVDDFDAAGWAKDWTASSAGALRVGTAGPLKPGREGDGVLVASLDWVANSGPDYLTRSLDIPRVAMTCRFALDLSSLVGRDEGIGSATLLALRDESQQDPLARDYARLLARQDGQDRQVRLVGLGARQAVATPWIPLAAGAATLEVQWQKTAVDESRLDLWIDGCGPTGQPCASGWELTGVEQPGLVTAVRLGILEGTADVKGEVLFDDVACAGDSWIEPE